METAPAQFQGDSKAVQTNFTKEKVQRGWMAGWGGSEATISPSIHLPRASFPGHSKMAAEVPDSCPRDSDTGKRTCFIYFPVVIEFSDKSNLRELFWLEVQGSSPSWWGGQGARSRKTLFTLHTRPGSSVCVCCYSVLFFQLLRQDLLPGERPYHSQVGFPPFY